MSAFVLLLAWIPLDPFRFRWILGGVCVNFTAQNPGTEDSPHENFVDLPTIHNFKIEA